MSAFVSLLDQVVLRHEESGAKHFSTVVEDTWLQGRTAFGGLTAALIVQAMLDVVPDDRRLQTLAVSFVGPVPAGEHQIVVQVLREGGSVSHVEGKIICDGEVAASVLAAFGKSRESNLQVALSPLPDDVRPASELKAIPYIEGLMPKFTQHYEMCFHQGNPPFSGGDTPDYNMWLRFKESGVADIPALIALADVPPLPGFNMVKPGAVGSSLTWFLEFPREAPAASKDDWWFLDYKTQSAAGGYFHNYATVWAPDQQAIMYSRQTAMVFQK